MPDIVTLEGIDLIPVLHLEPRRYAVESRVPPEGLAPNDPDAWHRFWLESMADAGVVGVEPLRQLSFHVPARAFTDVAILARFLEITIRELGGFDSLADPVALRGGFALRCISSDVLIEPGCCADLGNLVDWRAAAAHVGSDWQDLWNGHPWLSVKYEPPMLIVSAPHESEPARAQWAVRPIELKHAVEAARIELEQFALALAQALRSLRSFHGDPTPVSRKLAGLEA